MKKILLILSLIIGVTVVSKAQMFPEKRAKILQEALKLNDEQTEKITVILQDLKKKIVTNTEENPDLNALAIAAKAKVKAVMTKEQGIAYEKLLIEEMKKSPEQRSGGRS